LFYSIVNFVKQLQLVLTKASLKKKLLL